MDLAGINFSDLEPPNKLITIINHESLSGYHEYHSVWTSKIGEQLVAKQESHNGLDINAISGRSRGVKGAADPPFRLSDYVIID